MNINMIDKVIEKISVSPDNILFFGAGRMGEEYLQHTKLKLPQIIYDNDWTKWGHTVCGDILIAPADKLQDIEDKQSMLVLIMSGHDSEIASQIEAYGYFNWLSLKYLNHRSMVEERIENIYIKSCMIETSSFCNAKCTFCINPTMSREKMNMTCEVFESVIFRLKECGQNPEIFWLHCLGEPLIDPDLFQKVRRLRQEFPESRIGYASNFAIASREKIGDILECGQDFLVISLNAIDKDEYRDTMGLDYDRTMANIKDLLEARAEAHSGLEVTISIVENEQSKEQIQKFSEYWENKGTLVRVLKEGKWVAKAEHKSVNIKKGDYCGHTLNKCVCPQLYQEIVILSNGNYALCCFDGENCMELGNVKDTSICEVFHDKKRNELLMSIMHGECELDICEECSFLK